MTEWVQPNRRYEEGSYVFRIDSEPELVDDSYFNKRKQKRFPMKKLILKVVAINENGEFDLEERIPVWDDRYTDLLKALGIEHLLKDEDRVNVDVVGKTFEAEIKYIPDEKRPGRSWPHIVNIKVPEGEAGPEGNPDDEVPF